MHQAILSTVRRLGTFRAEGPPEMTSTCLRTKFCANNPYLISVRLLQCGARQTPKRYALLVGELTWCLAGLIVTAATYKDGSARLCQPWTQPPQRVSHS